jgi:hypothetical protein
MARVPATRTRWEGHLRRATWVLVEQPGKVAMAAIGVVVLCGAMAALARRRRHAGAASARLEALDRRQLLERIESRVAEAAASGAITPLTTRRVLTRVDAGVPVSIRRPTRCQGLGAGKAPMSIGRQLRQCFPQPQMLRW